MSKKVEERVMSAVGSKLEMREVRESVNLFLKEEEEGKVEHLRESVEGLVLNNLSRVDTPEALIDYFYFYNTLFSG